MNTSKTKKKGQADTLTGAIVASKAERKVAKPKPKLVTAAAEPKIIDGFKQDVRARGYKSLTVKKLLFTFGYQKRSSENIRKITTLFQKNGLTLYPELEMGLKPLETLRIYGFPVKKLGDLFEDMNATPITRNRQHERQLEDYIAQHSHYTQLGLTKAKRQHSPANTSDRFDFLCEDASGCEVALELKHAGGGKSAVEQVLRYIGMLKQENPACKARGILVTGIQDVDTAKALHGMTPEQQAKIEWHLYRFDRQTGALSFELVTYKSIEDNLAATL